MYDVRIFHKEARTLSDAEYDVSLVTFHKKDTQRDDIEIISAGTADTHAKKFTGLYSMYRTARNLGADVYHFHDPGLLPVGRLLANRTDGRIIYDCHEDYGRAFRYYNFPPDVLTPPFVRLFPHLQSALTKSLDGIIAATDWIAEDFQDRGHDPVALVRNFPKLSEIQIGPAPASRDHDHVLVYVGGLNEPRGIFTMLQLMDALTPVVDVELWLIGHFPNDDLERRAHDFVDDNGLGDRVKFFGYVDHADIFSFLAVADIGLALLDSGRAKHIIPTKVFEYMYARLPVIATETPATRRYLPDDCGRIVADDDIQEQRDIVTELLADTEKRRAMGENGRRRVEDTYCWEQEEDNLLSLYEEILR